MNIKLELLKGYISDFICTNLENFEINPDFIADTVAINALSEIQKIIKNDELSDFETVERIVCIFEKYKLDFGSQHNFY
ncbi:MAG: hypothetical protein IJC89_00105 [Clostridia bacterium]|nr:hypothetical protein [Clostridia bacterium]